MNFPWLNIAQWGAQAGWMPHTLLLLLEAAAISTLFAFLDRRPPRERLYYGIYVFLCFGAATVGTGWVMRLIHG